jgi:hypothetical protein
MYRKLAFKGCLAPKSPTCRLPCCSCCCTHLGSSILVTIVLRYKITDTACCAVMCPDRGLFVKLPAGLVLRSFNIRSGRCWLEEEAGKIKRGVDTDGSVGGHAIMTVRGETRSSNQ